MKPTDKTPPRGISLHNQRAVLNQVPDSAGRQVLPNIAPLRWRAQFSGGRAHPVDLITYPIPGIGQEASRILYQETQPTGRYKSPGGLNDCLQALRRFGEMVLARNWTERIRHLADITPKDIDELESFLRERHGEESPVPYKRMGALVAFMKIALEYGLASPAISRRLLFISNFGSNHGLEKPREPYSPYVAEQLRQAAVHDMLAAIECITERGPKLIAEGAPSTLTDWRNPSSVVWAIANAEFDSIGNAPQQIRRHLRNFRSYSGTDFHFSDLIRHVHLTQDDVVPFVIYLSLEMGIPRESVCDLKVNCLQNEARGYVDLHYVKRRKGANGQTRVKRVKLSGHLSPGAVIKALITVTKRTRERLSDEEATWLFIGYARSSLQGEGTLRRIRPTSDGSERFCERHEILDDQGNRLERVNLARLRKTYKAERYLKHAGNLAIAAGDHTKSVHVRHYANVEALRSLHEQTVAEAFQHAMQSAMEPIVLPAELEKKLTSNLPEPRDEIGLTAEQAAIVVNGTADVWLCSCLDNENSPFQEANSGSCRFPVWGCLECKNAVITSSKLPAVLAFLNHILERRQQMDLSAWKVRYGGAYGRIIKQILPRFPASEVIIARAVAASERDLMWLPAELTHSL